MSHHQKKDGKNMSHLQERWQKYVAPPKKSRIVKKKMTKKCRKIGQNWLKRALAQQPKELSTSNLDR